MALPTTDIFQRMATMDEPSETCPRKYTQYDFLRAMNDPAKKRTYEQVKLAVASDQLTPKRLYERQEWAEFVPTVYLDAILENTAYQSVSGQLATNVSIDTGLTFKYREFEHFQRAQRGAENTEFQRTKGSRRLQETAFHTLGLRSYITEEEMSDIPFSAMQLELNTMGAAIALERDLLWMDSLYRATSGTNATTFHNQLTSKADLDLEGLHGVLTWFVSPFTESLTTIDLTNPFESGTAANQTEGLMRLGKFRPTDVLVSPRLYFSIVNTSVLQQQYVWNNSRILDTGELQVPLLGVNIHKVNMGLFTDPDDPDSWTASDDIIVIDRRMGGGGTVNSKQPLQVRNWTSPEFRVEDFMIYERVGFAVQNRRALVRVVNGQGS